MMQLARNKLTVVANELPDPPYSTDTKANGFRPEVDWQRIKSSKTWRLCPLEQRNNLFRLWMESWNEVPAGSWENDDEIISNAIDMPIRLFQAHRDQLMRGWYLAQDGRFYHAVITEMVVAMLQKRSSVAARVKRHRENQLNEAKQGDNPDVTRYQHVSNAQEQEQEDKRRAKALLSATPDGVPDLLGKLGMGQEGKADGRKQTGKQRVVTLCPHQEIIGLYHEILPELNGIIVSRWRGSKSEIALRTRWKEDSRHQNLDFWGRFFQTVRTSQRWMGDNGIGWKADLHWLIKRANFDKVLTHMVNNQQEAARV